MSAIASGIALHGGYMPFVGTFLTFSDYARNALRMAALMQAARHLRFTHDSIGLGEDGPTHQAVEHAASLRLIPQSGCLAAGRYGRNAGRLGGCDRTTRRPKQLAVFTAIGAVCCRDVDTACIRRGGVRCRRPPVALTSCTGRADRHRIGSRLAGRGAQKALQASRGSAYGWCRCRLRRCSIGSRQITSRAVLPEACRAIAIEAGRD